MTEQLHFHFSLSCTGKGKATHSSVLAWRIPGTGQPDGLPSVGSHRVGHDCSNLAAVAESRGGQRRPPNKNVLELGPEKWIASQEGDDGRIFQAKRRRGTKCGLGEEYAASEEPRAVQMPGPQRRVKLQALMGRQAGAGAGRVL